jgi:hypothetical protein
MATGEMRVRTENQVLPSGDGRQPGGTGEPSLGELFRQLAQESGTLIRQEVALAKAEMRENVRSLTKDVAMLAAGGGVLLVAALVFTAFLVAGLGDLMGDEYWLGALIVGAVYALIGFVLLNKGKKGLRNDSLKPEQTVATLQADKQWAQAEAQQVKRDLTS